MVQQNDTVEQAVTKALHAFLKQTPEYYYDQVVDGKLTLVVDVDTLDDLVAAHLRSARAWGYL